MLYSIYYILRIISYCIILCYTILNYTMPYKSSVFVHMGCPGAAESLKASSPVRPDILERSRTLHSGHSELLWCLRAFENMTNTVRLANRLLHRHWALESVALASLEARKHRTVIQSHWRSQKHCASLSLLFYCYFSGLRPDRRGQHAALDIHIYVHRYIHIRIYICTCQSLI